MASVTPYLIFNGDCEEAFNFYKTVFGGEFPYIGRYKDMPPAEGQPPMPAEAADKIMHVSLPLGNDTYLMGSDSSDAYGHATIIGNNFSLSLNADSKEEADKLFKSLSKGGKVTMTMESTFWGSYFGMLVDAFGIQWMISHEQPKNK